MKHLLSLLVALGISLCATAIPAYPGLMTFTQPDGTQIALRLVGDETYAYYVTTDGVPVVRTADGFYLAKPAATGLTASTLLAHEATLRGAAETTFIAQHAATARDMAETTFTTRSAQRATQRTKAAQKVGQQTRAEQAKGFEGKYKGLVLLVEFSDQKFSISSPQSTYDQMMNAESFSPGRSGSYGSVSKYFKEQSYGKLDIDFDVFGPITLDQPESYYGEDSPWQDYNASQMLIDAAYKMDDQIDFSQYDWNGDGEVDQVVIIYAGYGQQYGAPSDVIWPHEHSLKDAKNYTITCDGVTISKYACSSELTGNSGRDMDGIGVVCHEFGHCLDLPDFYDTSTSQAYGLMTWSPMDQGCYTTVTGYPGDNPCGYTSYEKWVAGWLEPTELTEPCNITALKALATTPEAYVIYNDNNRNEYYLIENRQKIGADQSVYGTGMLVIHVDYDANVWHNNKVNADLSHPRCTIIPADGEASRSNVTAKAFAGDVYPGSSGNTALTDTSSPAAAVFTAGPSGRKLMSKPIENIRQNEDGTIFFSFMGGTQLDVLSGFQATGEGNSAINTSWEAVEDATYEVEIYKGEDWPIDDFMLIGEDFTTCKSETSSDIAQRLDTYFTNPGWTGSTIFITDGSIRLGSAKNQGSLVSPAVSSAWGEMTLVMTTGAYNNKAAGVTLALYEEGKSADAPYWQTTTQMADDTYVFNIGDAKAASHLSIAADARLYIKSLALYNGLYTYAEVSTPKQPIATGKQLTAPTYKATGLQEGVYRVRARAINGSSKGPWTPCATVILGQATDGVGTVLAPEAAPVRAYDLSGRNAKAGTPIIVMDGKKSLTH
ncbi:MAG: M6 family metalloprotease domain-containing protein [Bacteroidales bacterium]|nr:M6 family metalloprotease domain-containing protein [Candidatus Equimonas enterica]